MSPWKGDSHPPWESLYQRITAVSGTFQCPLFFSSYCLLQKNIKFYFDPGHIMNVYQFTWWQGIPCSASSVCTPEGRSYALRCLWPCSGQCSPGQCEVPKTAVFWGCQLDHLRPEQWSQVSFLTLIQSIPCDLLFLKNLSIFDLGLWVTLTDPQTLCFLCCTSKVACWIWLSLGFASDSTYSSPETMNCQGPRCLQEKRRIHIMITCIICYLSEFFAGERSNNSSPWCLEDALKIKRSKAL